MITFELAILLGIIFEVFYILIAIILKISPRKIIVTCILIAYLTVVASITLFPILIEDKVEITWYNYVPGKTIIDTLQFGLSLTALTQLLGNVLMTVPFGVMVLMLTENHKWWKVLICRN